MPLLVCLSLLGFCLGFARFSRYPIEYAPFFVVSSVITLLYFFAYMHLLKTGANGILIAGGCLLILAPFYIWREKQSLLQKYVTPGFVIFIGFLTLCLFQADHAFFRRWDEFTHWGPHAKLMLMHNGFLTAFDHTGHKSYPPAGALFQYLFLHLTGFNEGTAYVAQCLITMAPLSIFIQKYQWRDWKQAFLLFSLALLLLVILHIQIGVSTTMYMDGMAGIYFGMMIVAYLSAPKDTHKLLYLLPIVITLTLFKQKLLPLVLMATFAIIIYEIISRLQKKHFGSSLVRASTCGIFLAPLILPITSILTTKSWHHYLATIGTRVEWKMHLTFAKLHDAFFAKPGSIPHTVITNYLHGLQSELYIIAIILLLIVMSYFLYQGKKAKVMLTLIQGTLFLGFIAFAFGLLLMYLFSFSIAEGLSHASMMRYLRIYNLGWMLVTIYFLCDAMRLSKYTVYNSVKNILITCVILLFTAVMIFHRTHPSIWRLRQSMMTIANAVKKQTSSDAKIYIVWQKSNGFQHAILIYELTPRRTNESCGCVGKPYTKNDVWTCDLTKKQFTERLSDQNYLLLAYADKNFWSHYGSLIPNHTHLIPLVTYQACMNKQYHSEGNHPCHNETHRAYLFKIVNNQGHLQFINVKQPS